MKFQLNLMATGFAFCVLLSGSAADAAITGPYTADANTLHLWHLDEATVPAANAVGGGHSMEGLQSGATLNNASLTGFGTALSTSAANNSVLTVGAARSGTIAWSHSNSVTGAFTYEAIVRMDFDPADSITRPMQIISTAGLDVFQLRYDPVGYSEAESGNTNSTVPRLEFINVDGGNAFANLQWMFAELPTAGLHAPAQNEWFHVAVVYNGNENTSDNLQLYWTRMDDSVTQANQVGSFQMIGDLVGVTTRFSIGNRNGNNTASHASNQTSWLGLVDEVRISDVARGAGGYMFIPEPSSIVIIGSGFIGLGMLRLRKRQ